MPIDYQITNDYVLNLVLPDTPWLELEQYILENGSRWVDTDLIWNIEGLDLTEVTGEQMRKFVFKVRNISRFRAGLKTAVIATSDIAYGMMRMLAMLSENQFAFHLNVFRTHEDAVEWLHIPDKD